MDLNQISANLVNLVFYSDGETKEAHISHHDDPKPPPFQAHFQSSDSPSLFAGGDTSLAHQNQKKGGEKQNASTLGTKSDISSKTIPKGKQISWFGQSKSTLGTKSDVSSKNIPKGKQISWLGQSKSKTKQVDSVKSVKSVRSTFSHLSMLNRRQRFKAGKSKGGRSKISTLLRKTRTTKKGTSVAKSLSVSGPN
jgi:hypothetical protein